jgi:hypothetical protein
MKIKAIFIFNLFFVLFFSGCQSKRILEKKDITSKCHTVFTDIQKHLNRIDSNYFAFNVLDTSKTIKEEYGELIETVMFGWAGRMEREACLSSFNKLDIAELFGKPNPVSSKINEWYYVFNFGMECPCLDCNTSNYYGACNYIRFKFNEKGVLISCFLDPMMLHWER